MTSENDSNPGPLTRGARWAERYRQLDEAARGLGRLPRDGDDVPSGMVAWVKNQRRNPTLSEAQTRSLERVPGWSWEPRGEYFDIRAEHLRQFIRRRDRLPRRRAADAAERALALWLSRQRHAAGAGRLSEARLRTLSYVLRGSAAVGQRSVRGTGVFRTIADDGQ